MEPTTPPGSGKPSKAETIKLASQYLKTYVADEVDNGSSHFTEEAATLLKFHGSYQQDDRDVRRQLKKEGKEAAHQFMVRVRIVGGRLNAAQYLACDHLAQTLGNGTLRITTRQEFQLYGVLKDDLQSTIRQINEALLSTLAACGDVERNVLCCPAPIFDSIRDDLNADARRWARPPARREPVLTGKFGSTAKRSSRSPPPAVLWCRRRSTTRSSRFTARPTCRVSSRRPFPCRKTIAPTSMPTTSAFWAWCRRSKQLWSGVTCFRHGGGLGTTSSAQKTFPFLAQPLCYVDRAPRSEIGEAVLKVYRDFQQPFRPQAEARAQHHHPRPGECRLFAPRSKSTSVTRWPTRNRSRSRASTTIWVGTHRATASSFLGCRDSKMAASRDDGDFRPASGLRAFFEKYRSPARLTCQQKILLAALEPSWRPQIEA